MDAACWEFRGYEWKFGSEQDQGIWGSYVYTRFYGWTGRNVYWSLVDCYGDIWNRWGDWNIHSCGSWNDGVYWPYYWTDAGNDYEVCLGVWPCYGHWQRAAIDIWWQYWLNGG